MSRHLRIVNRHSLRNLNLASARNLRLGVLVLLLITINQIDEPLMEATFGELVLYWVLRPLVLAAGLWAADWYFCRFYADRLNRPEWLKPVVLVTALGLLPLAMTEAVLELYLPFRPEFVDDQLWAYSPVLAFLGEFVTIASIVIPLHLLLWLIMDRHTHRAADGRLIMDRHATGVTNDADAPAPEFLQRSSSRRVEDVLALQAEEHYVRIYSKDGTELVHCRFGEAAEEMPAELGLQVHRSWWVAESAVRSARRGSRRWQLDLVTDVAVPVSDSYVAAVRERGWLKRKPRT